MSLASIKLFGRLFHPDPPSGDSTADLLYQQEEAAGYADRYHDVAGAYHDARDPGAYHEGAMYYGRGEPGYGQVEEDDYPEHFYHPQVST